MKYTTLITNNGYDTYIATDEKVQDNYASAILSYVMVHNLDKTFDDIHVKDILQMSLKWDGCCDIWHIGKDEVSEHYCGFNMLNQYTEAIHNLYKLLKSRIKNWDGD